MRLKRILALSGAAVCVAIGYFAADRIVGARFDQRLEAERRQTNMQMDQLRADANRRVEALAQSEGEAVLRAFSAGMAPAVMARRNESLELAAVSLLRIPGVAGIHVLDVDGKVLYSSDAKLATTGNTEYRGAWALTATELVTRPSPRSGLTDFAMPIVQAEKRLAVVWLEFDAARVGGVTHATSLQSQGTQSQSSQSQSAQSEQVDPSE